MSREKIREDIDRAVSGLSPSETVEHDDIVAARYIEVGGEQVAVHRTNYQPKSTKEQFIVVGVDFGKPEMQYGGAIERGMVRIAVIVPSHRGSGLALRICDKLDELLGRGTIVGTSTQLFASQVSTIGMAAGDNVGYFRVDWSAPYMHGVS